MPVDDEIKMRTQLVEVLCAMVVDSLNESIACISVSGDPESVAQELSAKRASSLRMCEETSTEDTQADSGDESDKSGAEENRCAHRARYC